MEDVIIITGPLPKAFSAPSPTHPSAVKLEGQTAQAREDGRGSGQNAMDRGWGGGKEVSLRAHRHSPAPSRALIS